MTKAEPKRGQHWDSEDGNCRQNQRQTCRHMQHKVTTVAQQHEGMSKLRSLQFQWHDDRLAETSQMVISLVQSATEATWWGNNIGAV